MLSFAMAGMFLMGFVYKTSSRQWICLVVPALYLGYEAWHDDLPTWLVALAATLIGFGFGHDHARRTNGKVLEFSISLIGAIGFILLALSYDLEVLQQLGQAHTASVR